MKLNLQAPKHRSDAARALADRRYQNRVVRDKTKYSRKGRESSVRKFEDSIKPVTEIGDWFIEFIQHRRTHAPLP